MNSEEQNIKRLEKENIELRAEITQINLLLENRCGHVAILEELVQKIYGRMRKCVILTGACVVVCFVTVMINIVF